MVETILEYQKLQQEMPQIMAASKYKASYFMEALKLTPSTYYRKVSTAKFTPEELLKIVELVDPKAYYRWEFEQELKKGLADLDAGRTIPHEEVKELIKKELAQLGNEKPN